MTPFSLKGYQQAALDALRTYWQECRTVGAKTAFVLQTNQPYHEVEALPGLPYVCLRVPTGGGKTVMGCRAVAIAAQEALAQERAVVLWLVPTEPIKTQTLAALKNRSHPYRQVLDAELDGRVTALDMGEALSVSRATLDSETVIIVSTLANPRIGETDKRKVYEQNGSLMPHFDGLAPAQAAALEKYEGTDAPVPSLANVLRLRRPVVIMDEAHNARTPLAFETLARFAPSCIIEFTATPTQPPAPNPSNVLYSVSAAELKAAGMIKLPIMLSVCPDWQGTLLQAKNKRNELEAAAQQERAATGEYLRPIVLVQAQKKNEELTVEVVETCLRDELGIPAEQIAVETGERPELKGVDLFSETCPVRYIITVDKLREGWDCSFAYVLCSVRDMASKTAAEQIAGRVLRLPQAARKQQAELNTAFAFVTSNKTADTLRAVEALASALEANGFTKFEARQVVQQPALDGDWGGLFSLGPREPTPAERGERLEVPQLALWVGDGWEPVDETALRSVDWRLADCDPTLPDFSPQVLSDRYILDVSTQGSRTIQFLAEVEQQLSTLTTDDLTTPEALAVWLDRHIPHPDIVPSQAQWFLMRLVRHLLEDRHIPLAQLSRHRLRLRDAAARKIEEHRKAAMAHAHQHLLLDQSPTEAAVTPECVFSYPPDHYPANKLYTGSYRFDRHYYRVVGEMNTEEAACAFLLDRLPGTDCWVRNLERQPQFSFWLQTASDRFYPDFLARLTDGRILAVEYKGEHLATGEDTKEKQLIGALWAAKSGGRCTFRMLTKETYQAQLRDIVG
ncbi:MAG: DEAD/DEAH box helicase family protein [Armatimonadetes bacterium]|nr:DEAD/DEAH box helicase family protein [Armatimonadota bacterium]